MCVVYAVLVCKCVCAAREYICVYRVYMEKLCKIFSMSNTALARLSVSVALFYPPFASALYVFHTNDFRLVFVLCVVFIQATNQQYP